jgi:hypothetical protein
VVSEGERGGALPKKSKGSGQRHFEDLFPGIKSEHLSAEQLIKVVPLDSTDQERVNLNSQSLISNQRRKKKRKQKSKSTHICVG